MDLQAPENEQEDDDDWVQEQIRKGVGGAPPLPPPADPTPGIQGMQLEPGPITGTKAASEGIIASGEAALKALQQSVQRMKVWLSILEL